MEQAEGKEYRSEKDKEFTEFFELFEMQKQEISNLIGISQIEESSKQECLKIINWLEEQKFQKGFDDVLSLTRSALSQLLNILKVSQIEEESDLFEALKEELYKIVYSVKGWKWPPV